MSDPDPHLAAPAAAAVVEAEVAADATRADLRAEIVSLREEVAKLNDHRFLRVYAQFWRLLLFQLLRGMAFGLGSVVGATILVSVVAYLLSQVDFIPVVAEWAAELELVLNKEQQEAAAEQKVQQALPAPEPDGTVPPPSPPEEPPQVPEPGTMPPGNAQ